MDHFTPAMSLEEAAEMVNGLKRNIETAVFGQHELVTDAVCCLLSGGHILMTGAPGLAKTTLVRVFAKFLGVDFGRIQFTPDLLPSDITGAEILNIDPESGRRSFEFSQGPIFKNLLLADEINRASPRTQSALLEAMQERSCTIGGKRHVLPKPFMVFATQNPFESEGTFPLPEAQMDRFLLHTLVDYPDAQTEEKIFTEHAAGSLVGESDLEGKQADMKLDVETISSLIKLCQRVAVDREMISVIGELVRSSRPDDEQCPHDLRGAIWYGAGPRAGISLISTARALALSEKEESVRWAHVKRLAKPVLRHRIRLTSMAVRDELTEDQVIENLLADLESRHQNLAKGI